MNNFKIARRAVYLCSIVILSLLVFTQKSQAVPPPTQAPALSKATVTEIESHKVSAIVLDRGRDLAELVFKNKTNRIISPNGAFIELSAKAKASNVPIYSGTVRGATSIVIIIFLSIFAFLLGMLVLKLRQYRKARKVLKKQREEKEKEIIIVPPERFTDVAGCDEAVEELSEMLAFVKSPGRFTRVGAKIPSGVLLFGEPGTGKSLLAKAFAGEAGLSWFAVSGARFVDKYVGVGAKKVEEVFQKAKASAPAIIFIDEIDAIGRARGGSEGNINEEREATLNQLLVELDGFNIREQVIVVAATNRKDVLDPALLRAGRLENQIMVSAPGETGRKEIINLYLKNKPVADDVNVDQLARDSAGMTGANLSDMVNRGALLAARKHASIITSQDLHDGLLWSIAGPAKKEQVFGIGEEKKIAYHEAGHVITSEMCTTHEKSQRVTIVQRGSAGGMAIYGKTDRMLHDWTSLGEQLICLLGGRAAEKEVFGIVSSGAQNDLQRVTSIARAAISELALGVSVGQTVIDTLAHSSEELRVRIETEVQEIVNEAWLRSQEIVHTHRVQLNNLAEALLVQKDMDRCDIDAALEGLETQKKAVAPMAVNIPALSSPNVERPQPNFPVTKPKDKRRPQFGKRILRRGANQKEKLAAAYFSYRNHEEEAKETLATKQN
jgi:cell division protease FtsH